MPSRAPRSETGRRRARSGSNPFLGTLHDPQQGKIFFYERFPSAFKFRAFLHGNFAWGGRGGAKVRKPGASSAIKRFASVSPLPCGAKSHLAAWFPEEFLSSWWKKWANEKWADSSWAEEVLGKRERGKGIVSDTWKKMVDAKCDHVVETALKLIYIVFVKKDLERGSKCDKRKNWKFCKKIDAKSIKRNYEKCWGFRVQFRECFIYECSFIH